MTAAEGAQPPEQTAAAKPKLLSWLSMVAGIGGGAVIPGGAYFLDHGPPHFPVSALLTGAAALGLLIHVYRRGSRQLPLPLVCVFVLSLVLFIGYEIGLGQLSVGPPAEREETARFPTGFGMARWSLTEKARAMVDDPSQFAPPGVEVPPVDTPTRLMKAMHGYGDGPWRIWKPWTVNLAGLILIALFASSFLLWAWAWAYVARASVAPERSLEQLSANAKKKRRSIITYDPEDGTGRGERTIEPLMLIEGRDGMLLRALQSSPQPVIRHFRVERIMKTVPATDEAVAMPGDFLSRRLVLRPARGRGERDWFVRYSRVIREVVSDLVVEDWELKRVKAEGKRLGIGAGQRRAVHAYILAEYLMSYAEDGVIDADEMENLVRLRECLERLGSTLP